VSKREKHARILVALGGNAILKHSEKGTAEQQKANVQDTATKLVKLVQAGYRLIVTHGNGPQVGDILLKNDMSKAELPQMPLDICSAESQGMIGYMLQQSLQSEFNKANIKIPVATIVSQTLVDANDPAFTNPTKPVGPFYTEAEAAELRKNKGWIVLEDSGRGYRRRVPSPIPKAIIEKDLVCLLYEQGVLVIASGGGGVPVVRNNGSLQGVEGVIDKDRAAVLLAETVGAETLMILTDVDNAYLDYGTATEKALNRVSVRQMCEFLEQGQFASGSMKPKVEAAIKFVEDGGKRAIITSIHNAMEALDGKSGTIVTTDGEA
jgi:carbamate kinase